MTNHELSELVYITLHVPFVLQTRRRGMGCQCIRYKHARLLFSISLTWKTLVYACWTNSKYKAYQEKQVENSCRDVGGPKYAPQPWKSLSVCSITDFVTHFSIKEPSIFFPKSYRFFWNFLFTYFAKYDHKYINTLTDKICSRNKKSHLRSVDLKL